MIFTVTLNPSIDKTLHLSELERGAVLRAESIRSDLGGKGINVSRALQAIGSESKILTIIAGTSGRILKEGLQAMGFVVEPLETAGETRQNLTLFDRTRQEYTKINEPGPKLNREKEYQLTTLVDSLAAPGDIWAFCGSLPPGASHDLYYQLIARVQAGGAKAFLDSSGKALREGIKARPYGIKPNEEEAQELLGRPLSGDEQAVWAVGRLATLGPSLVVLSRGARGLVLSLDGVIVKARLPHQNTASPVGAGDAALAGLIWATEEGCGPEQMARRAAACGTAAATQEGTGIGTKALVEKYLSAVEIEPLLN